MTTFLMRLLGAALAAASAPVCVHAMPPGGNAVLVASADGDQAQSTIIRDGVASADWIAEALASSGYRADFSLQSLKEIDRFFDEHAPGGKPKPGGLLSRDLGPRIFALGAYVGEVIRRQAGGQWEGDDNDPEAEINLAIRLKSGSVIWPVQRIMKRYQNGAEDGVYAYGLALARQD